MPEFKPGDRIRYNWKPAQRGTVVGPVPYRHNDSGREDLIVEWDDDGTGYVLAPNRRGSIGPGVSLRQEIESHTIEHLPLIDRIGELDT